VYLRHCRVDVGLRGVDADDRTAGRARDLPGRATKSQADVGRGYARGEPEAREQPIHGIGSAMELVDAVELRLGEGGQMVFCELFDRGDEVGLKAPSASSSALPAIRAVQWGWLR
jgi:hypothetical protein